MFKLISAHAAYVTALFQEFDKVEFLLGQLPNKYSYMPLPYEIRIF